jgi:pSer/pThr/pTyr-binding forkhead associated (FHA) protein
MGNLRLVLEWMNSPLAFVLKPGANTIGRNPTNDFRISDSSVESFHLEIVLGDIFVVVRPINGATFINGVRIDIEEYLYPDMVLRIGGVELMLRPDWNGTVEDTVKFVI